MLHVESVRQGTRPDTNALTFFVLAHPEHKVPLNPKDFYTDRPMRLLNLRLKTKKANVALSSMLQCVITDFEPRLLVRYVNSNLLWMLF